MQIRKYNAANNASIEAHLTYQFWYPGNKLDHISLVCTLNFFFLFTGLTYNITTHMVIVALLVYSCIHLSLLRYRLRNYIPENLDDDRMEETVSVLKGLIADHQYLIDFTEQLNTRCKNIVMMEFILSSLDVASVAATIIKLEATEVAWLMFFFCLLVIQIFCLAWTCNELHFQSQAVADAAFESRWYLLNKEGKMLTQIIIARAQRPLYMTIGPFGPMTAQSFLMIMKAAYSYVSIMKE